MGATIRDLGFSSKVLVGDICNRFRAFHVLKKSSKRVNFQVTSYELYLVEDQLWTFPLAFCFVYQVGHFHTIMFGFIITFLSIKLATVVDKAHWAMRTYGMAKAKYAKRYDTHVPFLISDYFLKRFYFCFLFYVILCRDGSTKGLWSGIPQFFLKKLNSI